MTDDELVENAANTLWLQFAELPQAVQAHVHFELTATWLRGLLPELRDPLFERFVDGIREANKAANGTMPASVLS